MERDQFSSIHFRVWLRTTLCYLWYIYYAKIHFP